MILSRQFSTVIFIIGIFGKFTASFKAACCVANVAGQAFDGQAIAIVAGHQVKTRPGQVALNRVVVGVHPEPSHFFHEFLQHHAVTIPFYDGNLQKAFNGVPL